MVGLGLAAVADGRSTGRGRSESRCCGSDTGQQGHAEVS